MAKGKTKKVHLPEIEILTGSTYCKYSMLQNEHSVITENQQKLMEMLADIQERLERLENE